MTSPATVNKWIIASTVVLASFVVVMDVSIVNVAVPQTLGEFGITLDAITWMAVAYSIAEIILVTMAAWVQHTPGAQALLYPVILHIYGSLGAVRFGALAGEDDCCARFAGCERRWTHPNGAGHQARNLPRGRTRYGYSHLQHEGRRGANRRPGPGWIDVIGIVLLAIGLTALQILLERVERENWRFINLLSIRPYCACGAAGVEAVG
jgi:hypothetical protein